MGRTGWSTMGWMTGWSMMVRIIFLLHCFLKKGIDPVNVAKKPFSCTLSYCRILIYVYVKTKIHDVF